MSLKRKVVIITGANSVFGEATAKLLALKSAKLILTDRKHEELITLAEECRRNSVSEVYEIVTDLTDEEEVEKIIEATINKFERIDAVINCACMHYNGNVFEDNLVDIYDEIMNVNIKPVSLMTDAVATHLAKTKGCILNVSSIVTDSVLGGVAPYNIFKAALTQFTKCIALELAAKGVRINTVLPGPFSSDESSSVDGNEAQSSKDFSDQKVLKTAISPDDIAEFLVSLADDILPSVRDQNVIDIGFTFVGYSG